MEREPKTHPQPNPNLNRGDLILSGQIEYRSKPILWIATPEFTDLKLEKSISNHLPKELKDEYHVLFTTKDIKHLEMSVLNPNFKLSNEELIKKLREIVKGSTKINIIYNG